MEERAYIGTYEGRGQEGHVLVTPDGRRVVLEPAPILDSRLREVPVGAKVKVQKTGTTVPTKGGRKVEDYRVFVAKDSLQALRQAAVPLPDGSQDEPPGAAPPPELDALRGEVLAQAAWRQAGETERERQVAWLRQEAARLGYRLVRKPVPVPGKGSHRS